MIAVQGSLSVGDALVTLRAHTFAIGEPLSQLAAEVVKREVRLDPSDASWRQADSSDA